ncbi:hypothetical protein ACIFOT_12980 [Neobacillus sp. NRS-1170]|uniref:hypothetical protein n=1 Tax=Neobacillus sp. NRS-1170 TaxID=3233898 RepID=UPI003D26CF9B
MKKIKFNDFMSGEYKAKEKEAKKKRRGMTIRLASSAILPIATFGSVGTLGFIATTTKVFANPNAPVIVAVPATAGEWMGEHSLSALAHVLDPVVDILVALSFPIASVIIVGSCFQFMFNRADKGWQMIQNAGLGYVLIQVSPLILNVLKQVGNAV